MRWFQRLSADTTIRYRNGAATASNGKLMQWKLHAIAEKLASAGINDAEIWLKEKGPIQFSKEIPDELHQGLRNIIVG